MKATEVCGVGWQAIP